MVYYHGNFVTHYGDLKKSYCCIYVMIITIFKIFDGDVQAKTYFIFNLCNNSICKGCWIISFLASSKLTLKVNLVWHADEFGPHMPQFLFLNSKNPNRSFEHEFSVFSCILHLCNFRHTYQPSYHAVFSLFSTQKHCHICSGCQLLH